ncbi:MAG: glycosyltransferase [Actinomycetota bacterium]|nr:glycosyltransferase [Actinomycetota bacterium]MDP9484927.1 glycosyltransferase [Actinomycetota bacterium]
MRLSVIMPTLNEEASIGALLRRLSETPGLYEVIVADGGSSDATPDLVRPGTDALTLPPKPSSMPPTP